jgi:hypothetical protein
LKYRCSKSDSFEPFCVTDSHQVFDVHELGLDFGHFLRKQVVLPLSVIDNNFQLLAVFPVRVVRLSLQVVPVADVADLDELRRVLRVFALSLEAGFVRDSAAERAG